MTIICMKGLYMLLSARVIVCIGGELHSRYIHTCISSCHNVMVKYHLPPLSGQVTCQHHYHSKTCRRQKHYTGFAFGFGKESNCLCEMNEPLLCLLFVTPCNIHQQLMFTFKTVLELGGWVDKLATSIQVPGSE